MNSKERSLKYLAFIACERFGITPVAFRRLPRVEQLDMMAFADQRNREMYGDNS